MRHSVPCVWIKRSPLALSQKLRLMVITGVLSCFTQQVGLCDLLIMFILLFSSQEIHRPIFGTYLGFWKFISGKFHVGLLELKLKIVYLGHFKNRHLQSQGFGGTWHCFVIWEVACTYISSSHLARVFSKKKKTQIDNGNMAGLCLTLLCSMTLVWQFLCSQEMWMTGLERLRVDWQHLRYQTVVYQQNYRIHTISVWSLTTHLVSLLVLRHQLHLHLPGHCRLTPYQ